MNTVNIGWDLIVEKAGGTAIDAIGSILEIEPEKRSRSLSVPGIVY
ncbi:MAG: hypothetical protein U5K69_20465 [Balneolaceae bacterium]|nr:hypothetical protein [Balneolaceae bacterium]